MQRGRPKGFLTEGNVIATEITSKEYKIKVSFITILLLQHCLNRDGIRAVKIILQNKAANTGKTKPQILNTMARLKLA